MNITLSKKAEKAYIKLPLTLKKKTDKQFKQLLVNMRHPSLRLKKMQGHPHYEARIDYHYRFIFSVNEEYIEIIAIGPHDDGLGKK